jgi:hypothetical protein
VKRGCFGSIIAHQPRSEVCAQCPDKMACGEAVHESEPVLLEFAQTFEDRYAIEGFRDRLEDRFRRRWSAPQPASQRKLRAAQDPFDWSPLLQGANPAIGHAQKHLELACEFILQSPEFKTRDLSEYLREQNRAWSQSTVNQLASRATKTLADAGVLKNIGKGLWQLQSTPS